MKGARIIYSAQERAFVQSRAKMPRAMLHAQFVAAFGRADVTVDHLKSLCSRNGWATRAWWTADDDALLLARFPHEMTATLARALGRSVSAVSGRASQLGLKKTAAYLASPESGRTQPGQTRGASTRFKPGQTPPNKSVKHRKGWAPGRMKDTQFIAGQSTWNHMPLGSTRLIAGYEYTKVRDTPRVSYAKNWTATHILNWEAAHGQLPAGHALKCLDSNRLNTAASNWTAVPRSLLPRLNGGPRGRHLGYDDAPVEIKPVILTIARLAHAAKRAKERAA